MLLQIDRLRALAALLLVAAIAGPIGDVRAQQADHPRRQQTQQKPKPAKPPAQPTAKQAAAAQAAKLDSAGPSQIGTTTVARFAYMMDAQTGAVILAKDADTAMAPSSMAKMMTIYLLFEDLTSGKLKMDTRFKVSERAYAITRGVHSSTMFLEPTDEPTVAELIQGIIVDSGNDASVAVAEGMAGSEESFAERMNKKARELGMTGTVFKNASGWPAEGQRVTAHDLAVLAARTVKDFPEYYRHYAQREFTYNGKTQPNRNLELKSLPGADGLKTGHTEEGGFGQTTSAIREGRRLVLVLNGMSSIAERAQETSRLIEWGFRETTNSTLFQAGDRMAEAPVWLGAQETVPLVISQAVVFTKTVGQTIQPRAVARFDGPLPAPIVKGAPVGTVVVTMPDGRAVEYPLQAGADVPRAGLVSRMSTLVKHYILGWMS